MNYCKLLPFFSFFSISPISFGIILSLHTSYLDINAKCIGNNLLFVSALKIKNLFIDFLGVDVVITDIIMIGSLVNYNWSKYSDIDLHIVVNFNQFPENSKHLYLEFFDLKKVIFNQKHNIKLFGYDVECFVQREDETTFSSGIYSILYDMWMNEPKKSSTGEIDKDGYEYYLNYIQKMLYHHKYNKLY